MPPSGHPTPPGGPTVLAAAVRELVLYAERRGVDRGRLLLAAGIDGELLERKDARLPHGSCVAVWHELERITGDPDLGLDFAEAELSEKAYGVVGFLAMTSATAGEAIARTVAFQSLIKEHVELRVREEGRLVVVEEVSRPGTAERARSAIDHALAAFMVLGRRWTGGRFAAREARFRHPRPRDTSAYERMFRCALAFEQREDGLVFDAEMMALPLQASQPDLRVYLESLAQAALDKRRPGELADSVREAIHGALAEGDVGLPRVARRLGLSARTLQRRLEDQKLVYRDLVDEVRREEALSLVRGTDLSMIEVSERLGYSEAKAFRRAFRRWTGVSPVDVRRGLRAGEGGAVSGSRG